MPRVSRIFSPARRITTDIRIFAATIKAKDMCKTNINILKGLEIGEARKKLSERYVLSTQFVETDRSTGRPRGIYVFVRPGRGCVVIETGKGNIVTDVSARGW